MTLKIRKLGELTAYFLLADLILALQCGECLRIPKNAFLFLLNGNRNARFTTYHCH